MDWLYFLPFIFVGACVVMGIYSAFYTYRFVRSYHGKFRKAVEYLFYAIVSLSLLVIEFGTFGIFGASTEFAIILSITAIVAFFLLLRASKKIYKDETSLVLMALKEKKNFLDKKAKILKEKYFKRRIDEKMFKELVKDLEKEAIDIDTKIIMLKQKEQK